MALSQSFYNKNLGHSILSREKERKLFKKYQHGDQAARKELVEHNLRLVHKISQRYENAGGLNFEDIFQYGCEGLLKAIEHFDLDEGTKFSTYAPFWIRQAILKALMNESRTIRLPSAAYKLERQIKELKRQFKKELNREPSVDELAELLDKRRERIIEVLNKGKKQISLDRKIKKNDQESVTFAELLAKTSEDPASKTDEQRRNEALLDAMNEALTKREEHILKMYYGLKDLQPRGLENVGLVFDVSRERIRQLRNRAIEKLRTYYNDNDLE